MHADSHKWMEWAAHSYCRGDGTERVLDVGALDVNGSYRDIFVVDDWKAGVLVASYTGADIVAGKNVDLVMTEYRIPVDNHSYDVVISGNTIEHVRMFWLWAKELARVLKPGGLMILAAPARGWGVHRHPVDCWRIFEDGMRVLLDDWLGFEVLEVLTKTNVETADVYGIARKPSGE